MAITDADGFETYANKAQMLQGSWLEVGLSVSLKHDGGATGDSYITLTEMGYARMSLGGVFERAGVAFNFKPHALPKDSNHTQCLVRMHPETGQGNYLNPPSYFAIKLSPTGRLMLMSTSARSTLLATSKRSAPAGAWSHGEILIGREDGLVEVFLNGILEISLEGREWTDLSQFSFGLTDSSTAILGSTISYDNVVVQGSNDNTEDPIRQLGILGVYYTFPKSDVLPQDWELTSGSAAYALVNERHPDDDLNYIFSNGANNEVAFEMSALPSNVDKIEALIPMVRCKKSDMGDVRLSLGLKDETVEYAPEFATVTNYINYRSVFERNHDTDDKWLPNNLPNMIIKRTV